MKVLVTGGNGFLGSSLALHLLKQHQVVLLVRSTSNLKRIENKQHLLTICKFKNADEIDAIIKSEEPDVVLHTACSYGRKNESVKDVFDANVVFGLTILNSLSNLNKKVCFINFGTILSPETNIYSFSKNQFSELGKFVAQLKPNINFTNILLQHIYGPGDDDSKFATYIIKSCHQNINILNLTKGEQLRDFIYIDDVLTAIDILFLKLNEIDVSDIELGSGEPVRIQDFVLKIHQLTHSTTTLVFGAIDYRKDELMYSKADLSYLKSLGWQPAYSWTDGLSKTIKLEFL